MHDRDTQVDARKRRSHVRGHIIIALRSMFEKGIPVRGEALKKAFEIATDFRIRILLDEQRSARMLDVQSA